MDPRRWQRIKNILDEAAAFPAGERPAAVAAACGDDSGLLRDVRRFLEHDDDVEELMEEALWSFLPGEEATAASAAGDSESRIGPYRLERVLGHGGMGTVYLAVREDDYTQRVALKVVSWYLEGSELLDRFYNERQILAHLQHPAIARLLDGGTTETGRPYLVMEYVEGEPIDTYCDRLPIGRRLELFQQVCAAVHVAHQNLVVHRDLKASNILVTADGTPRLLDFGIAKLLETGGGTRPVATLSGQAPMTPACASPEQLLGEPITTACDVYALGVLLYRLLTGRAPYRLEGKSQAEMVRAIVIDEPARPSIVVTRAPPPPSPPTNPGRPLFGGSPAAAPRAILPAPSRQRLAGDLDAIVLKAMRKEPEHRYTSVAELAEDIERHLESLPVHARQGSWLYNSGKFVRRNKLVLAAMLSILVFAVTSTVLWRRAVDEGARAIAARTQAERAQARAERVSAFLEDLFISADPDGGGLNLRQILDRGRQRIATELEDEPELEADLLRTLGIVYNNLGLYDEALRLRQEALRLRRSHGDTDPDLATELSNLGNSYYEIGDYVQAEAYFREALAMRRQLQQDEAWIARTLNNLVLALMQQGHSDEAEALLQDVLEIRRRLDGEKAPSVATTLYSLGMLYSGREDFARAEPLLRRALAIRREHYGGLHTAVADVESSLGRLLHVEGHHDQARALYEKALATRRQLLGEDHARVANLEKNLAALALDQGAAAAALYRIEGALRKLRRVKPAGDWTVADAESVRGACLAALERFAEAEVVLQDSYQTIREVRGDEDFFTREARRRLVALYESWGREEQAAVYRSVAYQGEREPE